MHWEIGKKKVGIMILFVNLLKKLKQLNTIIFLYLSKY